MGGRADSPGPRGADPGDRATDTPVSAGWASRSQDSVYRELEHPADLLLEITGPDLAGLFENALYAFYEQVALLDGFRPKREMSIAAEGTAPADALRSLLSEALYRFATEGFVAVSAEVRLESVAFPGSAGTDTGNAWPAPTGVRAVARLRGENAKAGVHTLATEIKAVTYHRLGVERRPDGTYLATVLFDI